MDAQQLNRINELAREYLRLGIAKSTTDAVEKARFQLSFDQSTPKKESQSPYDVLFKGMPEQKESDRQETQRQEQQPTPSHDRLLQETRDMLRHHETRISSQFLEIIEQQKKEIESQRSRLLGLENEFAMLKRSIRDSKESNQAADSPASAIISSTIEQTIKGRVVRADDVAIDKIFYFGNK
jgi:hypothetical protein